MTTSTAVRAGTDTIIEPLAGGSATGLPLLGIIADVMSQIPGMPPQQERPAESPRPDGIRPRGTTRSRADTMKTNTRTTAVGVRIDPNG